MRKICGLASSLLASASYATTNLESAPVVINSYTAFQQFDREYSLGYGVTSGNVSNGASSGVYNSQFVNLEVERLFDVGVWLDVNASLLTYYSQAADPSVTTTGVTTGSQPMFGGVNAKVGYAFTMVSDALLLTPYALGGRNTNLATYVLSNNPAQTNLTQDYYWSMGGGARLEYRLNKIYDFYLDQNMLYNASQAPVNAGLATNDSYSYTTTLGAKFNLYRNFQLGAQGFYTNYYFTQALNNQTPVGQALVPVNQIGGMLTVGLTY